MNALAKYNYPSLPDGVRDEVVRETRRIQSLVGNIASSVVQIGDALIRVKGLLPRGQWGEWLDAEFRWSDRTARNFMSVAEAFAGQELSGLDIQARALYMLASPSTKPEVRQEALDKAKAGEQVTPKVVRELRGEKVVEPPPEAEAVPERADSPTPAEAVGDAPAEAPAQPEASPSAAPPEPDTACPKCDGYRAKIREFAVWREKALEAVDKANSRIRKLDTTVKALKAELEHALLFQYDLGDLEDALDNVAERAGVQPQAFVQQLVTAELERVAGELGEERPF